MVILWLSLAITLASMIFFVDERPSNAFLGLFSAPAPPGFRPNAVDRRYRLKSMGYDLNKLADKVADLFHIDAGLLLTKGRQRLQVEARSVLCHWAVGELGMTVTELARVFGMTPSAVSYAVRRGKTIAEEKGYSLSI